MKRATVYLSEEEAERLRRLADSTGQPQSELIRRGIHHILSQGQERHFRSAGVGSGDPGERHWTAEELYRKVFGER